MHHSIRCWSLCDLYIIFFYKFVEDLARQIQDRKHNGSYQITD
uniref:Uncharacterized protein n=1 Tax=Arundo donax TaxID=35708 RepID=A0A0A8XVB3_ARUDO